MKSKLFIITVIAAVTIGLVIPSSSAIAAAVKRIAFDATSIWPPQVLYPGYTKIEMPSTYLNLGEGYSIDTSEFTAGRAGIYQFNAQVSIDRGFEDCSNFSLLLFLNGQELRRLAGTDWGSKFVMSGSGILALEDGDIVDVRVYHDCGGTVEVEADGGANFNGAYVFQ